MFSHKLTKFFTLVSSFVVVLVFQNCSKVIDSEHASYQAPAQTVDFTAITTSLRDKKDQILSEKCQSECYKTELVNGVPVDILDVDDLRTRGLIVLGRPQDSRLYKDAVDKVIPPAPMEKFTPYETDILSDWIAAEGGEFSTYIGGSPIDTGGGPGQVVTFTDVRRVLQASCTNCHRAMATPPNLDQDAIGVRNALYQGQPIVVVNNAANSRLYQSFARMPTGGALGINSSQAGIIRTWINLGAP